MEIIRNGENIGSVHKVGKSWQAWRSSDSYVEFATKRDAVAYLVSVAA